MSILVAYFSRADENYFAGSLRTIEKGNTEVVAEKISELNGADLFKIEMKTPYSKDYKECIKEAQIHKDKGILPELASVPESLDAYDQIVLAYPNYWGTYPMAVLTFLKQFDFTGKTIYPLCTNEGSGMGSSESDLKKELPGADIRKGLSIRGSDVYGCDDDLRAWLRDNELL